MADEKMNAFQEGLNYLSTGDAAEAEIYFDEAAITQANPLLSACRAYCLAKVHGEYKRAITLGLAAIRQEPRNAELYLLLGRIHSLSGQKATAVRIFRLGLRCERNPSICKELDALGDRRVPPIPFLMRSNPINRYLGKFLKRMARR